MILWMDEIHFAPPKKRCRSSSIHSMAAPCKELKRRISAPMYGWDSPSPSNDLGFDCESADFGPTKASGGSKGLYRPYHSPKEPNKNHLLQWPMGGLGTVVVSHEICPVFVFLLSPRVQPPQVCSGQPWLNCLALDKRTPFLPLGARTPTPV